MGGRGSGLFPVVKLDLTGIDNRRGVSPLITAGLAELRGNEADPESTLRHIDKVRFNELTHEQLFVVDRDGFVLEGYDGDKGSVAFPTERAAEWKDHIVTHRHPDSFGGTFSPADIYNMAKFGWSEQEASANEGRYNAQRTRTSDGPALIRHLQAEVGNLQEKMREIAKSIDHKEFVSRKEFLYESRKRQVQVFDDWYKENLPKHGFTYSFIPREEQNDAE